MTGTHKSILDFSDLQSVVLRGNDFPGFDAKWDEILLSITEIPADPSLERFVKMGIRESEQLKSVLALYDRNERNVGVQVSAPKGSRVIDIT